VRIHRTSILVAMLLISPLGVVAQSAAAPAPNDALAQGFLTPPDSAKPRAWWHWTNGNVTESGITKDLQWMQRAGIGGFQLVDVAQGNGQVVEPKINFGTEEWYHAVLHSAQLAKQLDLEMSIFSCAGWSEAGGPWVTPEMAMKGLVWSETDVEGGKAFAGKLAEPPSNEGSVRDSGAGGTPGDPHFYRDSAVVAYRTPQAETSMASQKPTVTTSSGPIDGAALMDDSLTTAVTIAQPKEGGPTWLQYEFATPFTARAMSLGSRGLIPVGKILASDDGSTWREILATPGPQGYHGAQIRTFAFPAVTAKYFRVEFDRRGLGPAEVIHGEEDTPPPPRAGIAAGPPSYAISEAIFYSDARVNRWEDKGAFGSLMDVYDVVPTPDAPSSAEIARGDILDLTSKMDKDGTLHWDAPAGHWTILRMGYSLTGARNRPSVPAGSGLEVDKLSSKYVQQYFAGYMNPMKAHLGDLIGSTVQDEVESMMVDLVEKRVDGRQQRISTVHRPQPVAFIPYREEACAILIDELRGVLGVDAQSAVNCSIQIAYTGEIYPLSAKFGICTAGCKRPLAQFSWSNPYRPYPLSVIKARYSQLNSARSSYLCGECECKWILRRCLRSKREIIRLPAHYLQLTFGFARYGTHVCSLCGCQCCELWHCRGCSSQRSES